MSETREYYLNQIEKLKTIIKHGNELSVKYPDDNGIKLSTSQAEDLIVKFQQKINEIMPPKIDKISVLLSFANMYNEKIAIVKSNEKYHPCLIYSSQLMNKMKEFELLIEKNIKLDSEKFLFIKKLSLYKSKIDYKSNLLPCYIMFNFEIDDTDIWMFGEIYQIVE